MVIPRLIFARTRTEDYASNNKTIARRSDQWIKWDIESLFHEAKAIQESLSKTKAEGSVKKYEEFDECMSKGKISYAIQSLTGGLFSVTDRVVKSWQENSP